MTFHPVSGIWVPTSGDRAPSKRATVRRVVQLTGRDIAPFQTIHPVGELADPSPPVQLSDGRVRIYGTGQYFLEYESWSHLLRAENATRHPIALYHPNGMRLSGQQPAWDINVKDWNGESVLYAGVMVPPPGKRSARWPYDNWTRRVHAFALDKRGRWTRQRKPVIGEPATVEGWIGHSYGHHFLEAEDGSTWVFYERVSQQRWTRDRTRRLPYVTEIFARRMVTPFRADDEEHHVLGVGDPPYPSTHRRDMFTGKPSGYLVEGPRPARVEIKGRPFYLMGFSSGDFPTDHYSINIAWSTSALGPYVPVMRKTSHGDDFADLGEDLRRKWRLSFGPARPAFFQTPDQSWWVLFHAVRKDILPDRDYSRWPKDSLSHYFRKLFVAPLELSLTPTGEPTVKIPESAY